MAGSLPGPRDAPRGRGAVSDGAEAGHIVALAGGSILTLGVVRSAIRTVILPRGVSDEVSRAVFLVVRVVLLARTGWSAPFARRDRLGALYAPLALLGLLATWLLALVGAYTALFWGLGERSLRASFELSGSSAFTLGFETPRDLPSAILVFTEAGLALLVLALLITYLPTIYGAFSRREAMVASLETRAGSPPSAAAFIRRLHLIGGLDDLDGLWEQWERWFVELQETHTSYPAVAFLRSPLVDHSWVTAAGALLDTAAIIVTALDRPQDPSAQLCLRAGWLSLRRIAALHRIPFDRAPSPGDPVSVSRQELDAVLDALAERGIRIKADRDRIWADFAGWRVNYDSVVLDLATLTAAPPAAWSSDRPGRWQPWWLGRPPPHRLGLPRPRPE